MGDTVGVRIDGEIVARPSLPATGRGARAEPDAAQPMLRRRALIALAGLLSAVLMLSGAVGQLRVHAIPGAGTAGLIRGIGPCPPGRACAISAQPSAQMWEATYLAFPDYAQIATTVVFDAQTGQSYSQSMTLRSGDIVIRLTVVRDPGSVPGPMSVDVTAASTDGTVVTATPTDGSTDRIATAALSGPADALLPIDAAIGWVSTADLFGDAPS